MDVRALSDGDHRNASHCRTTIDAGGVREKPGDQHSVRPPTRGECPQRSKHSLLKKHVVHAAEARNVRRPMEGRSQHLVPRSRLEGTAGASPEAVAWAQAKNS